MRRQHLEICRTCISFSFFCFSYQMNLWVLKGNETKTRMSNDKLNSVRNRDGSATTELFMFSRFAHDSECKCFFFFFAFIEDAPMRYRKKSNVWIFLLRNRALFSSLFFCVCYFSLTLHRTQTEYENDKKTYTCDSEMAIKWKKKRKKQSNTNI